MTAPTRDEIQNLATELSRRLTDEGKIIEAGWAIFRGMVVPTNAPDVQVSEMRYAFMAGAQHLFASVLAILDPGEEPTAADLNRMDLINAELGAFAKQMELRHGKPGGTA